MAASATIDPEKIRAELSELWVTLANDPESGESGGVLRACSMTLVTGVDESDDPAQVGETLASLMREHPSRAIVIRLRETGEPFLSSRVFAQCWMPFGHRRQICCEQVEITSSDASLADVPAVVLPLTVADLPIMLWCRSARLFSLPAFSALAGIAHKIIIDSSGFPQRASALDDVQAFAGKQRVADLSWTRLTRWRELIAQIFENRCYLAELGSITSVRILFEGEEPAPSAFYMGAWLAACLKRSGASPVLAWERSDASSVILETAEGVHTSIRQADQSTVDVRVRNHESRTVFPPFDDYSLLREELSIPGRDPVYEAVLAA
ncbi:MAG: Glucose-6-P dehydrogenase subunit-like protein, partial [Bryobacterales bacterium]|nr:Glucose-6-P dehydrogenase subunit-like protein [Bryobacterales bacterium]